MNRELSRSNRHVRVCILFLISILLLVAVASQTVKANNDYAYTVTDGKATITGFYTVPSGDVVLPSVLGGYPVVAIADGVFGWCNYLISVTIPDGVTRIGNDAFYECSELTSVTIPSSVTSIGDYAFYACLSLTSISVDSANSNYMSINGVLFDKEGTILIQYPIGNWADTSYVIPDSVTTIGIGSFAYCSLTSITIPSGVVNIGNQAFENCFFTDITLPSSITSIGNKAFYGCLLTSVTIPSSVTSIGDYAFSWSDVKSITFLGLTPPSTGTGWISGTSTALLGHAYYRSSFPAPGILFNDLTMGAYIPEDYYYTISSGQATITGYHGAGVDLTIPATLGGCPVIAIGNNAFMSFTSLTSITIPNSVTSIGNNAFQRCSALTSVTIPNSVTNIGNNVFAYCSSLSSVTVPDSVTSMGSYVFYSCTSLSSITLSDSLTSIGNSAFFGCASLSSITIPSGVTTIGSSAFRGCTHLESITMPDSVTSIGDNAFYGCSSLSSIVIPNGVTSIGNYAFQGCSSLSSVTISNSVTSIGSYAFYMCSSLSRITVPDSVTSIGDNVFSGCSSLSSVNLGRSVTGLSYLVFSGCPSLTEINVNSENPNYMSTPAGVLYDKTSTTLVKYPQGKPEASYEISSAVTTIGDGAFDGCTHLESITVPVSVTSIGNYAFQGCSALNSVSIPNGVTTIGNYAFQGCSALSSITIPNGVTRISNNAFYGCSSLRSIIIPEGVTSIGWDAFRGCSSLSSVTIPDSVTSIGGSAFEGCGALRSITIPDSVTSIGAFAFSGSSLSSIDIPNSVTSIGNTAFGYCSSLSSVTISNRLTSITSAVFYGCSSLSSITIPASVTSISDSVFDYCTSLTNITFLGLAPPNINLVWDTWIDHTPSALRGHAYYGSTFPVPGSLFNGLKMGAYIPEDYYYTVSSGQATITGYHGTSVDLTIPATLAGCPVLAIGDNAFMSFTSLTSITIPNSVTSIGNNAFSGCTSLSSITFLGLTPPTTGTNWISDTAYELCGHAYYGSNFPAPGGSFSGLTMADYIPENYYYTIASGQATITGYYGISKDITIPSTVGGCPVVAIGDNAFYRRPLTSVIIPDSVTSIGNSAFKMCSLLTSITIPESVTSIGDSAFQSCSSLGSITLPASITSISAGTFYGCRSLTSVAIPAGITSIGDSAFFECSSMTSIAIPKNVISIGNDAFVHCSALESVTISNGVTTIGNNAFEGCSSLTSVTIPASVTSIGNNAFYWCSSLTEITVDNTNPNFKSINGILFDKSGTTLLQYPIGKLGTSYEIPTGVTTIGLCAFAESSTLTSITIPSSVTSVGDGAFYRCTSLANIIIPSSVISIGDAAFRECSALGSVIVPSGVTNIGDYTFAWCDSLASVSIPESVTSIGDYAFDGCTSLSSITIPSGVTSIGDHAFYWCSSLTGITFLGLTPPAVDLIYGSWIDNTNSALLGHAYYGSSFPAPGGSFNGLKMGNYLLDTVAPTITSVAPSSPITLSTQGTTASQTFSAAYTDNVALASATITLDGTDVSSVWGVSTSGFSYSAALPIGSHTIVLTVKDIADSQGQQRTSTQTWTVNVRDVGVPVISNISPSSSPLILYNKGASATQTFIASYTDNLAITSATVTLDGKSVTSAWGATTSGFSYSASLAVGSHTIILTVSDAAGNKVTQTWSVTVVKDTKAPAISGIADQKITYGTSITVTITDSQSGVNWDSLKVTIDNKDITTSVKTANGFTLTSTLLTKGAHTIAITVADNVGNTAKLTCSVAVK